MLYGQCTDYISVLDLWMFAKFFIYIFSFTAGAKAFVCEQCGAQFSKEDAYDAHRRTHNG